MLSKPIDLLRDRRGVYGIGISDAIDRHALAIACGYHSEARLPRALILRPDALTDPHNGSAALQKITGGFRHGPFVHCAEEHLRQVIHYRMLRTAGLPWPPQHPIRYWSADEKQQARNRQVYHGLRCGSLGIINKLIGAAIEAAADPDAIKMARRFAFAIASFWATLAGSRFRVSGSTSAKTGLAPARTMELALAKKLKGEVTTSSPGRTPTPASASHRASVPEAQPTASRAPHRDANSCSNFFPSSLRM